MLEGSSVLSANNTLPERAFSAFERLRLDTQSPLLVALSGGPDSSALLALLARWRRARNLPAPHALVVDHGLRAGSDAEALRVVQRWNGHLGCQVATHRLTELAGSGQAALREARYQALGEAARSLGADVILTGHQVDDQIETLLERLSRGSGIAGLAGLSSRRRLYPEQGAPQIVRPLLFARKSELSQWLGSQKLAYELDPSNDKTQYARARWRHQLQVLSGRGIAIDALVSLSAAIRALRQRQAEKAEAVLAEHASWQGDWAIRLNASVAEGLEPASRAALLAGLCQVVGWCDYPAPVTLPSAGCGLSANRCILRNQNGHIWIMRDPRCFSDMGAGPWRSVGDGVGEASSLSAAALGRQAAARNAALGIQAAGRVTKEQWPEPLKALNLPHSVAKSAPLWCNSRGDWQLATKSVLTLAPNFQRVDQSYRLVTSAMQLRFSSSLCAGSGARASG